MACMACPACQEFGRSGSLELRQINAREAIYVCSNSECTYPIGLSVAVVERPVPELIPLEHHPSGEPTANNVLATDVSYVHQLAESPPSSQVSPNQQTSSIPDIIPIDDELDALLTSLLDNGT